MVVRKVLSGLQRSNGLKCIWSCSLVPPGIGRWFLKMGHPTSPRAAHPAHRVEPDRQQHPRAAGKAGPASPSSGQVAEALPIKCCRRCSAADRETAAINLEASVFAVPVAPKLCAGLMDHRHLAPNGLMTDLGSDRSFGMDLRTIPGHGNDPERRTQASSFLPDTGCFGGETLCLPRNPQEQAVRRDAFAFSPSAASGFGNSGLSRFA